MPKIRKRHYGILTKPERDAFLTQQAKELLAGYYMKEGESSPQETFARAAVAYCYNDLKLAQRIYDYASKRWLGFSTPVLANAPKPGEGKLTGLPISCFLQYVPDTLEGLIDHTVELRWLSVKGGGVGGHWSDVRSVSQVAPSPIPFLHTVDADVIAYHQGTTRRGSYAAYMDVSHPDIIEFIGIRTPTGDIQRKAFNIHHAVNLSDEFMEAVVADADWNLIDPHDQTVRAVVKARSIWERLLETRARTGEPYYCFIDAANRKLPQSLKNCGLSIHGSNLCNEIFLPTHENRTAVCCLSSVNLEFYDEWKDTEMVEDCIKFLDNVLQYFIDNAPTQLKKAKYSAERERSLGLGAMGFHHLLQKRGIPFESASAVGINREVFNFIKTRAVDSSKRLATERGEYLDGQGTGMRNAHLLAIAPNANSAAICGTSPSIEPVAGNAFTHRTRAGSHLIINPHLVTMLEKYGKNNDEVMTSIIGAGGSVQHLDFLNDWEKSTLKTAEEIDQHWLVEHAANRQEFVCQGQSLNLFFQKGADRGYVNSVHLKAWKSGLKGLYYYRTESGKRVAPMSTVIPIDEGCVACEG